MLAGWLAGWLVGWLVGLAPGTRVNDSQPPVSVRLDRRLVVVLTVIGPKRSLFAVVVDFCLGRIENVRVHEEGRTVLVVVCQVIPSLALYVSCWLRLISGLEVGGLCDGKTD